MIKLTKKQRGIKLPFKATPRNQSALIELLEAERHRADALAATLLELRDVVTHDHETKTEFIARIKKILGADPDDRLIALFADKKRLDWLADRDNLIGNVQLTTDCVMQNMHSLRSAIDAAMRLPQPR